MKNRVSARFTNLSMFLAVAFLILFSAVADRAQNKSSEKCSWKWRDVWELQAENQFNGFTGKLEVVLVNKLVKKYVFDCEPPQAASDKKSESPVTKKAETSDAVQESEKDFKAPADSPLLGTWKYIEYLEVQTCCGISVVPPVKKSLILTYSPSGDVETQWTDSYLSGNAKGKWLYTSKSESSGILEEYQKSKLIERGTVRWINKDQFEYTVTFHANSGAVGNKMVFTRQ